MPLSKAKQAKWMREYRGRKKMQRLLKVTSIMSPADVRAMRAAGIEPEYIEDEKGKVASYLYYALLRDRDAVKAHLSWLQSDLKSGKLTFTENR